MSSISRAIPKASSAEAAARSTDAKYVTPASLAGLPETAYLEFRDEKAAGTNAPDSTTGSWLTRVINTEHSDVGGHGSLAANQITLAAGTYECQISVPAYAVGRHQARLQNITDATTTMVGRSAVNASTATVTTESVITGRFTIAAQKTFEVQHRVASAQTNGLGLAANFGHTETYTVARFWKVA